MPIIMYFHVLSQCITMYDAVHSASPTGAGPHSSRDAADVLNHIRETQAFIQRFEEADVNSEVEVEEVPETSCILAEEKARGLNASNQVAEATSEILEPPADFADVSALGPFAPRDPARRSSGGAKVLRAAKMIA